MKHAHLLTHARTTNSVQQIHVLPNLVGQGVQVQPYVSSASGKAVPAPHKERCYVVCIGFHADAPARAALMKALAVTAYLGCLWCYMTQVPIGDSGKHTYMGYSEPVQIVRGKLAGQHRQMVSHAD